MQNCLLLLIPVCVYLCVCALSQFIPLMLPGLIWPYQENSTFTSEPSTQPRGRSGWWRSERPKLASRTTGQREKKVFGWPPVRIGDTEWTEGFQQPWRHLNCRAPGKHGGAENKDVGTETVLWPSFATSEQDQGERWASGYARGTVWMWNKRSFCCGWHYSVRRWYAVLFLCVSFSDWRRHWKHGEVHMCYFPEDTGGVYANSKPYVQPRYGNAESPRIAAGSSYQTSKGFSVLFLLR